MICGVSGALGLTTTFYESLLAREWDVSELELSWLESESLSLIFNLYGSQVFELMDFDD